MPKSNPANAVPALVTPAIVKPGDVVMVLVVIPIVATETRVLEAVAKPIGVADVSPYALSVSVFPAQPVPPLVEAEPAVRVSTSEKEIVDR